VDEALLEGMTLPAVTRYALPLYRELPPALRSDERIKELALRIVGDKPRGWKQIKAVEEYLRNEYIHVRDFKVPEDRDDPVPWFLFDSKTGPDYLFAAAACVLLRQLNYPARVVSGFYVDPADHDPESGQVSVRPDDIHFWTEILLPGDEWVVVEPTPGYEKLPASPDLLGRLALIAAAIGRWLVDNLATVLLAVLAAALVVWQRRRLLAGLYWLRWRLSYGGPWRRRVMSTLRLLEAWAGLEGQRRPVGWTPLRWYERHLRSRVPEAATFFRLIPLAAYSTFPCVLPEEFADRQCKTAVRAFWASRKPGSEEARHD
ncbi:MAG: transglutaminase-like domain-containing protein, partial [Gemmatales bacterium]|nr:transglutaminase-like domain-containing protein [Gemmatales bacterium]MDW8387104.1 transglutaminase-like domain-containing protein [Gemmatales bacterium]